jgi:arylsulfatase
MIHLVELWWAEAGRFNVLPLDDRFQERLLGRAGLAAKRTKFVFRPGAVRIPESAAPDTKNRSWAVSAVIEIPDKGADGPIVVMGGDTGGWSLYLKGGVPMFAYNFAAVDMTYVRASQRLGPGRHTVQLAFEVRREPRSAGGQLVAYGGTARLSVDGKKVADGEIAQTMAFAYSLDETFDVGCDKGSPVTDEYEPLAAFTGKIVEVTVDLHPEFAFEADKHTASQVTQAMVRQ